jgi:TolB-like protein
VVVPSADVQPPDSIGFVNSAAARAQIARILASRHFAKADRLKRFLCFVSEETLNGPAAGIKETVIGIEVFGRHSATYDPRIDPIVRIQAGRVRAKLNDYYAREGAGDAVLVELPRGQYVPRFSVRSVASAPRSGALTVVEPVAWTPNTVAVPPIVNVSDDRSATPREQAPEPGPSLAVLPFASLSDDPEQAYFAEGLTEDIITALARLRWLLVTARNSSFTYRGRAVDVKQVGRELGVRYVLEGSVRRSGDQVRVSAQLADTATGSQMWARRYDAALADFFALQDQIAESVVATIEPQLYAAENLRFKSKSPESLDAWGFVMRAMPLVWDWGSAEDIKIAEALLNRATAIDPDYPRANSLLAWMLGARAHLGLGDPTEILATALAMAQRAIKSDPDDPWGHFAAGYVFMVSRHSKPAVEELKEAIDRNPSFAHAHVVLAATYAYAGRVDDGLGEAQLATRLSPRDYTQAATLSVTGLCHLIGGRFQEAVEFERRAVQLRPHFGAAWRTLSAAAGLAGDLGIAASALAEAKRLQPSLSIVWVDKHYAIVGERDRALYIEGLRAAGL